MKTLFFPVILMMMLSSFAVAKSENRGEKLAKKLGLSSEQMDKIKTHKQKHKGKRKELKKQIKQAKDDFDKAFLNGDSDSGLKALHAKLKLLRGSQMDLHYDKLVFMKSILTQEQRQKFIEMKKGRKKRKGRK